MRAKSKSRRSKKFGQKLLLVLVLAVPLAVACVSAFLPLKPFAQQALVGIILVWLYAGALIGFHFSS